MLEIVEMIIKALLKKYNITEESIKKLGPTGRARVVAYVLAPSLILLLLITALYKGWLGVDLERAFTVSELKTVVTGSGGVSPKRGVVIIAEPTDYDYLIPIAHNNSEIWSALAEEDARDNTDAKKNNNNLSLGSDDLHVITSFSGVSEPVAIVVEGELGKEVKFRGSRAPVDDWRLSSRRNANLAFWPLAICFLAYGIAVVRGVPIVEPDQHDASQVGAEPDEGRIIEGHTVN
jgi:hypothetical protein